MSIDNQTKIELRLLEALREKNIAHRAELADRIGLSRSTVIRIFEGKPAHQRTINKIKNEFNPIRLEWILTGEGFKYEGEEKKEEISIKSKDGDGFKKMIEEAIIEIIPKENTHKLILAYLEELLDLNRRREQKTSNVSPIRRTAQPYLETTEVELKFPEPPSDLTPDDKARWEKNIETLQRWSRTEKAFWVPSWALKRFCKEVYSFYQGAELDDVGGLLKDFMEEGRK
jgi:DNA-binding XRE family transcriptional regulator